MASTILKDAVMSVLAITDRSDSGGTDVDDQSAEETRMVNLLFTPGVGGTDAWKVTQRSPAAANLSVEIGSGTNKTDLAIVPADTTYPGQGAYLVRLDASGGEYNLQINAADGSHPRVDEVYVVVIDKAYGGGSIALPRIGYRVGTPASTASLSASASFPGADSGWSAYLLLARILVASGAGSIVDANIDDQRDLIGPAYISTDQIITRMVKDGAITLDKMSDAFSVSSTQPTGKKTDHIWFDKS